MTMMLTRRDFVTTGAHAGAGLVIAFHWPGVGTRGAHASGDPFKPNAWLQVAPDGTVTIWTGRAEMGQGVKTAMPMIVAEELDADWRTVRVVQAEADPEYGDQFTVGSRSVRSGWMPLRTAGAQARAMLLGAAAATWGVPVSQCRAREGTVVHRPTGRALGYGELAPSAATQPVPDDPPLKRPEAFRIVGRRIPRVDTPAKVRGAAVFGIDVRVPGMRYAAVARSPVFGGRLRRFDPSPALAITGVTQVVEIERGVAVVAEHTWAAFQGQRALACEWDEGVTARWDSAGISRAFADAARRPGEVVHADGDVNAAFAGAARVVEAVYEVPYLAHATMEPMNCTAHVREGGCEIWAPTQAPQGAQREAARITGLAAEQIAVHTTYLGGGFGRKANTDYVGEAVELSQKIGAPVQVVWTREDDIRHGRYRPATYNSLRAALDAEGRPTGWTHRLAAPDGPDFMILRGATEVAYAIPNVRVERLTVEPGIPIAAWRSVAPSQNCFVIESFVDELAHAAGRDPYQFRRELLRRHPRLRAALDLAVERAGWGGARENGRGLGIAVEPFGATQVAQVAEVSVETDGRVRVHRVVCAVDCGTVINPDTVAAQVEGSIVYGLTAALYGEITIERGRARQSNFHDYQMLRLAEMPAVEVHIVPSTEAPGGVGEPAVPPIAPAVCNAIFAATGKRIRRLPIGSVA